MNDKNQSAIDHVTSVSKHPHATMIVKWLITGWDVVYKGHKDKLVHPCWVKDEEYELIEPKPAKPAYRVYMNKDGDTFSATRYPDGTIYQAFTKDVEWLSDWKEYDLPKKWPTPLVERIAAIDLEAAQWIVDHWDDLLEDKYTYKNNYSRDCDKLTHMFDWETPPQGTAYWGSISDKLGE